MLRASHLAFLLPFVVLVGGCAARPRRAEAPLPTPRAAPAPVPSADAATAPASLEVAPVPPQFWGLANVVDREGEGTARLVAGNQRVEIRADGTVTIARVSPSERILESRKLSGGRWAFVTADDQLLAADSFLGPFTSERTLEGAPHALATGAVAAARRADGRWVSVSGDEDEGLGALGDRAWALHFVDARTALALRAPGEVVRTTDGGESWRFVELSGDLPIALGTDADDHVVLVGLRGHHRFDQDRLVPAPAPAVAPAVDDGPVLARWETWWRVQQWPREAPLFWLRDGAQVVMARSHRDALYWTAPGALHRLRRDGTRQTLAIPATLPCTLAPFGEALLARCQGVRAGRGGGLFRIDPRAFTATPVSISLTSEHVVQPSSSGGAILLGLLHAPEGPDVWQRWTEEDPAWRRLDVGTESVSTDVDAHTVLSWHGMGLWTQPIEGPGGRVLRLGAGHGLAQRDSLVLASLRRDGGFVALATVARGEDLCALYLSTGPDSVTRREFEDCSDVRDVRFVDARFGVLVNSTDVLVTRDGGEHLVSISRALGVPTDRLADAVRGARASNVLEDAVVVSPHRVVSRDADPCEGEEAYWHLREIPGPVEEAENDFEAQHQESQRCGTTGPAVSRPVRAPSADLVPVLLFRDGVQLALELRRTNTGVTLRASWSGPGGVQGAFTGSAPWAEPTEDFASPSRVGYALRGVSASGVLLERCLLDEREGVPEPARCDVRWFATGGRVVEIAFQRIDGDSPWVQRAAPDGGGWVVELGSVDRRRRFEWSQWQHWTADGRCSSWGDLRRDLDGEPDVSLARVGGVWGAVVGAAGSEGASLRFEPHGTGAARSFDPGERIPFCAAPPAADADRWWHTRPFPRVLPSSPFSGPFHALLAATDDGWCVARMGSDAGTFGWTRLGARARRTDHWWMDPPGRGAAVTVTERGQAQRRSVRCEVVHDVEGQPEE